MKVLKPGHSYLVDNYPAAEADDLSPEVLGTQLLEFMFRIGEGYPGNVGIPRKGTNCQEVLRVLIDRVEYLDNQKPHHVNKAIIKHLRAAFMGFEHRAAELKHSRFAPMSTRPEELDNCRICGHLRSGCYHEWPDNDG